MYQASAAQGHVSHQCRTGGETNRNLFTLMSLMLDVSRERRQLRALDRAALKDMGLDQADVAREIARPFWDLPVCRMARI